MALSSGSSVSEDVWTLIKMCRASGRVLFLSSIPSPPPPHPYSLPVLPFVFLLGLILRIAISSYAVCACDRHCLWLLKRPGSVTWTAAARSSMCEEPMRPEDVSSFPATDRPPTDWPAGFGARRRTRSLRLPVWHRIVALCLAKTIPPMCLYIATKRETVDRLWHERLDDFTFFIEIKYGNWNKMWKRDKKIYLLVLADERKIDLAKYTYMDIYGCGIITNRAHCF